MEGETKTSWIVHPQHGRVAHAHVHAPPSLRVIAHLRMSSIEELAPIGGFGGWNGTDVDDQGEKKEEEEEERERCARADHVDDEHERERADPFKDVEGEEKKEASNQEYVHIRVQQRNGRKSITTVQGLQKGFDYKKVLKAFKKEFCCNGSVVEDKEHGQVIQLQGDQRKNVSHFLVEEGICKADLLKIHGF